MIPHDPFGRSRLPAQHAPSIDQAVDELRAAASVLEASGSAEGQRVAARLANWLTAGGDLQQHLGVRPGRGKYTATPTAIERTRQRDGAILSLAAASGATSRKRRAEFVLEHLSETGEWPAVSGRQMTRILARLEVESRFDDILPRGGNVE